ncbi:flagellin [Yoonia sp. 208BN28-4]|uniref:flagellin n=1 Tax=Yoonia sp. 208BN28-4 TaxID=3126505 RepID=UPI0030B45B6A
MITTGIGDGMRQFQLSRQTTSLKSDLGRLSQELSTGQVADRAAAADGRTAQISGIEHSLAILKSFEQTTRETGQLLGTVQSTLSSIDDQRGQLAQDLIVMTRDSPAFQIDQAADNAADTFESILSRLNIRSGDRSVFSGAAVDQPAVTDAVTIIAALQTAVAGDTTAAEMTASIAAWFDDPAGYQSIGYTGDDGPSVTRDLSATDTINLDFRADTVELKHLLKAAATAAMADALPGLSRTVKAELLAEGGIALQGAASDIAQLQGRVGYAEATVERVTVTQTAELTTLTAAKSDYVTADPFETATRLQALQVQLETHYALTSRLSRLNLTAYL